MNKLRSLSNETRKMLAGLLILLLLLIVYLAVSIPEWTQTEEPGNIREELLFFGTNPDTVTSFSFSYRLKTLSFTKNSETGSWIWTENPHLSIRDALVLDLLGLIQEMTTYTEVKVPSEDLSEYGLDVPQLSITITDEYGENSLYIGRSSTYNNEYYCKNSVNDRIFMTDHNLISTYSKYLSISSFLKSETAPRILPDRVHTVTVENATNTLRYTYLPEGYSQNGTTYFWTLSENNGAVTYLDEDYDIIFSLFFAENLLAFPELYEIKTLESYSLGPDPETKITITYFPEELGSAAADSEKTASFCFYVGDQIEESEGYYISLSPCGIGYSVTNEALFHWISALES